MTRPLDDSRIFDNCILAGEITPGLAAVKEGKFPRNWEEKKGQAQSGATIVYQGDGLAEFTMTLQFCDGIDGTSADDQIEDYEQRILPLLTKQATAKNANDLALEFFYPWITVNFNVTAVVCTEIGQVHETEPGIFEVDAKFKQFRPPKPANAKPSGAKAWTKGQSAGDEADKAIDDLKNQVNDLNK